MVTCPHNNSIVNSFQYNLNKAIRDTTSTLLFKKGNADARWAQNLLKSNPNLPFKIILGWKTAYTDKHGRTQKTGHGPDIVQSTSNGKTLHPTLFHAKGKHLEREHIQQAFQQTPRDTIDIHWIRAITKHLPTQRLYSAVNRHPSHPDLRNLTHLHREKDPPSVHGYCLWDAHSTHINDDTNLLNAVETHITYNPAPLLIISKDVKISGLVQTVTIPEGTLQINTGAFWKGRRKNTTSTTNITDIFVHMSPSCTQKDVDTVDLITRLRNTQKYERNTDDNTHAIFLEALHYTPRNTP